ncbi:MAG: DUF2500 domain-containing protein [Propionibacteriaceae bacterium]|nr:DUF2500 domain-containing protein [Propionibacteriaceae bacterium]
MEFVAALVIVGALLSFVLAVCVVPIYLVATRRQRLERKRNRSAPMLSSLATVVEERVSRYGGGESSIREQHFATFEMPDGSRFELAVPENVAGVITAGDVGQLTWQGSWFIGFQRQILR